MSPFPFSADLGHAKTQGQTQYDAASQSYQLQLPASPAEEITHFSYEKITGDFLLTAEFQYQGAVGSEISLGWMCRTSLEEAAIFSAACLQGDGKSQLNFRLQTGAPLETLPAVKSGFRILQLEKVGNLLLMRAAHPGEPLQMIGARPLLSNPDELLVGLFLSTQGNSQPIKATVHHVRISHTTPRDYRPDQDGYILGCRLETMEVATRKRTVLYESAQKFEAPNWMPDGKNLLFNQEGKLFTIPVEGGTPTEFNTGSIQANNNDHGISFDGKLLAISSHREGKPGGGSTVYVLPIAGGEPTLVTEQTPSYWHGWHPDGKSVVYVARRPKSEQYDIYRKPINGGAEVQLTHNGPGEHADGCEYSPDGQYIYYNGSHSGTMQIWRMKADGSEREQVTFDQYNDWFPHLSPDGKWMVFLSYPVSVAPNDHPSYQPVMLRMMPVNGGPIRVLAYLYGGQGTINVPSWSPDSKRIAFVSNGKRNP